MEADLSASRRRLARSLKEPGTWECHSEDVTTALAGTPVAGWSTHGVQLAGGRGGASNGFDKRLVEQKPLGRESKNLAHSFHGLSGSM